jgi:PLP dependent protein
VAYAPGRSRNPPREDGCVAESRGVSDRRSVPVWTSGLSPSRVRANLERVLARIEVAGRNPGEVEICAVIGGVPTDELEVLREAGVRLVGAESVADLREKRGRHAETFTWDFVGPLPTRRLTEVTDAVRLIHRLASNRALRQLQRRPAGRVLIEVGRFPQAAGIAPGRLGGFLDDCPVPVLGLSIDAPAGDLEVASDAVARVARLGRAHGLPELSVAAHDLESVEAAAREGATILRLGEALLA